MRDGVNSEEAGTTGITGITGISMVVRYVEPFFHKAFSYISPWSFLLNPGLESI
jgi:hypothetical protein